MKKLFPQTLEACQKIGSYLENPQILSGMKDAPVAMRVIGEFSGGKTRFLREIFGPIIPKNLEPVSSTEAQTFLPLEITYGPEASLELIQREQDYDARTAKKLEEFSAFPAREELKKYTEPGLRLRLYLPEERLILPAGDGYTDESGPQLLRVIDHPGWNSQDDAKGMEELGLSREWKNFALAYVCNAKRAQSANNRDKLKIFLEAVRDEDLEPAASAIPLYFIITDCEVKSRATLEKVLQQQVEDVLGNEPERYPVFIKALDFHKMPENELNKLRLQFWEHLAKAGPAIGAPKPDKFIAANMEDWPQYFKESQEWLEKMQTFRSRLQKDGAYMFGRTMRYFEGMSAKEISERAWQDWQRHVGSELAPEALEELKAPDLPKDHLLRAWLDAYWLPRLNEPLQAIKKFVQELHKAIGALNPNVSDLEDFLTSRVRYLYEDSKLPDSCLKMLKLLGDITSEKPDKQFLATLLALSLLETKYNDVFEEAK